MTGACEILFVISLFGRGEQLSSQCMPTFAECDRYAQVMRDANEEDFVMWQCVEIGALVDGGRADFQRGPK